MNANGHNKTHSSDSLDRQVNKYVSLLAFLGGALLILLATLKSFDFGCRPLNLRWYLHGFLLYPSSVIDFPSNIILFLPFGFGLAALLTRARWSNRAVFLAVLLAGFLLTWLVETLQFFLPGRTPNVSDILANTLGALAGWACLRLWQNRPAATAIFRTVASKPGLLLAGFLIYLFFLANLGIFLRDRAQIVDWRSTFPLLIGNEQTGNRAWKGSVRDLVILDQALPPRAVDALLKNGPDADLLGDALVAHYPLTDATSLADETRNLPDLQWRGASTAVAGDELPTLDGRSWLKSERPAVYLVEKLQESSQFSLIISFSTADLAQRGPARILSSSISPFLRNLTLGQEMGDLFVRVRTPLAGPNGTLAEATFPDIFVDHEPHELVVTYDGLSLTVFLDKGANSRSLDIVPGIAFFYTFYDPFVNTLTAGAVSSQVHKIFFYLLAFIPVGIFLLLIALSIQKQVYRTLLLVAGIVLPALLFEAILTARIGYIMRLGPVLIAAAVVAGTYMILVPVARKLMPSPTT